MKEALSSSETSVLTRVARRSIPEDTIFHSHRHENLKSYIALIGWTLYQTRNVSPVKYELGFYIPEDDILHSHRRESLKPYTVWLGFPFGSHSKQRLYPNISKRLGFVAVK
jgi:hypothetical protein